MLARDEQAAAVMTVNLGFKIWGLGMTWRAGSEDLAAELLAYMDAFEILSPMQRVFHRWILNAPIGVSRPSIKFRW